MRLFSAFGLFLATAEADVWSIAGIGSVNGTRIGAVYEFYGIPYANASRFGHANPYPAWHEVREASSVAPECAQGYDPKSGLVGIENCLTLDVRSCSNSSDQLLPVLLWIHGGGLTSGSSTEGGAYNGTSLVAKSDCGIVYVAIQYRLGLLGFLDVPQWEGPANLGFRDQQQALQWVQDHIHNFGGDNRRVTIFGESAGGSSVAMHLASPLSRGLFAAAIAESTWTTAATGNKPRALSQVYGAPCAAAACPQVSEPDLLGCMQRHSARHLFSIPECSRYFPWVSVDGVTFKEPVWKTVRKGGLHPVPIIVGGQTDEWQLFAYAASRDPTQPTMTNSTMVSLAILRGFDWYNLTHAQKTSLATLHQVILQKYPAKDHPTKFPGQDGRDTAFLTDVQITCMTDQMTRNHKHAAYRYLFSHRAKFLNDTTASQKNLEATAYHTLEMNYVFNNFKLGNLEIRDADLRIRTAMQDYWISMSTSQQPKSGFSEWPLASEHKMLEFGLGGRPTVRSIEFRWEQCDQIVQLFDAEFQ